jgi:hypothetical protein
MKERSKLREESEERTGFDTKNGALKQEVTSRIVKPTLPFHRFIVLQIYYYYIILLYYLYCLQECCLQGY